MTAALVCCAHGTRSSAGRGVVAGLVAAVAERLPDVPVHEAYVDVHGPAVDKVVAGLPTGRGLRGVVVPLLLATGYHVRVDVARAVSSRPDVVATRALGPDDRLVDLLLDRLREAGAAADAAVVLAPTGSSDAGAQADSEETGRRLARRWAGPVSLGYAAGHDPSAAVAVARARRAGAGSVAVASYLLAPGVFQDRLAESGADVLTAPLSPDPRLVDIVLDRYRTALRDGLTPSPTP